MRRRQSEWREWPPSETLWEVLTGEGRIRVDEHLRVQGFENVYAIGDITDTAEEKLAYLAGEHAKVSLLLLFSSHHRHYEEY